MNEIKECIKRIDNYVLLLKHRAMNPKKSDSLPPETFEDEVKEIIEKMSDCLAELMGLVVKEKKRKNPNYNPLKDEKF